RPPRPRAPPARRPPIRRATLPAVAPPRPPPPPDGTTPSGTGFISASLCSGQAEATPQLSAAACGGEHPSAPAHHRPERRARPLPQALAHGEELAPRPAPVAGHDRLVDPRAAREELDVEQRPGTHGLDVDGHAREARAQRLLRDRELLARARLDPHQHLPG